MHCLARDAGVSQATGCPYPHEGIDVLARQAPDPHDVLNRCRRDGMTYVILDGTLIESDRVAVLTRSVVHTGDGWLACECAPALYKAATDGLPTLADKGYIGVGVGIHVPVRRPKSNSEQPLHVDTRTTNTLIRDLRALGERAAAELKERWRALKHVSLSPSRIGDIARATLILNGIWI